MLKVILQKFKNNATSFGLISIIGGFITDVLQPIAPFSSYIFFASTVTTLVIFLAFLFKSTLREKLSNSLVLALSIMIITGAISLLQKYSDNDKKGLLANNFKVFEKFQNQLGIIETQISEVKDISTENLEETKKISKQIEKIEKKIDSNQKTKLDQTKLPLKYKVNFNKNNEISIFFQPVESPREFYVSNDDGKNFNSLGFLDEIDQRTGLNLPKSNFSFSSTEKYKNIQVKYLDINSVIKGPFELNIDLIQEFKIYQKKKIKNNKNKWVQINNYSWSTNDLSNADPSKNTNIYGDWNISFLLKNRCALKSVIIKLDDKYYMRGLGFNNTHVTIRLYESSFKEKKIVLPNCDLELKNYDFKEDYKPSKYITKSSYKTTDAFTGKEIERNINLPSKIWEKKFSEISIKYSEILDLLKYEDMNLEIIYNDTYAKGPLREIAIRVEYFDGETSVYRTYKNYDSNE